MHIDWKIKQFSELSTEELYQVLRLRSEVFVVEQKCAYLDMDNADQLAIHVMGWTDGGLAAYTRLFAAGIKFDMAAIGRVVTAPFARNKGIGRILMQFSISTLETRWGKIPIKIGAQLYLQQFYESLGFVKSSEMYMEDDIPHIEMIRTPA
ncbi:GNAT family N-acetyltransferase [Chitinophaga alhagiae]|uniref:GNAT family N-acetyltransferase n=1 Tax=Chitinophaga alhagiae TaxID=2203219 RepID=A0ABM6WAY1_9BACT|nr:GNAT family N-acetyltransferase [Chitinophaga alhagiae]AWO01019.1 GNAT family N-acetyltransferase [Chitinophaga alhagiae]